VHDYNPCAGVGKILSKIGLQEAIPLSSGCQVLSLPYNLLLPFDFLFITGKLPYHVVLPSSS